MSSIRMKIAKHRRKIQRLAAAYGGGFRKKYGSGTIGSGWGGYTNPQWTAGKSAKPSSIKHLLTRRGPCVLCGAFDYVLTVRDLNFCEGCGASGVGAIFMMWVETGVWPKGIPLPDFMSTPVSNIVSPASWNGLPDPSEFNGTWTLTTKGTL